MLIAALAAVAALVIGTSVAMARQSTTAVDAQYGPGPGQGHGPGRPGPGKHMMAGEVTKIDGSTITLKTLKGEEKSVQVDGNTKYRKPPDGQASLADVKVGEKIGVMLDPASQDPNLLAKAIMIGEPPARGSAVVGDVVSVNGDTLTIKTAGGAEKQVQLPAITQGSRVGVQLGPDGAVRGVMYNPPQRPQGAPDGQGNPPEPSADDGAQPPAEGNGA